MLIVSDVYLMKTNDSNNFRVAEQANRAPMRNQIQLPMRDQ